MSKSRDRRRRDDRRDEKQMARDYRARMTHPLSEAERDAVAAWLGAQREVDR